MFCAPSLHGESFGVVLIEAMAAGTAIVASGLDGYRNVATDDVDAVLVEPGDAEQLATALKRALYDDELRVRLTTAGQTQGRRLLDAHARRALRRHYRRIAADRDERRRLLDEAHERRRPSRMLGRVVARLRPLSSSPHSKARTRSGRRTDRSKRRAHDLDRVGGRRPAGDHRHRHLQRADPQPQPGRERLVTDRRAAEAPHRPHPQPGRDREGLRGAREGDARRRHQGPQRRHGRADRPATRRRPPTTR